MHQTAHQGQKIKLVIAACLWNNPQICVLDEPSNFLDREALGGLAVAIRDWAGAVVCGYFTFAR